MSKVTEHLESFSANRKYLALNSVTRHDNDVTRFTNPGVEMESMLLAVARPEWMDHASCKGRTNLFFGIAGERPERRVRREATARAMCAACPVNFECRELARDNRENGLWGGENEEERAAAGHSPRSISRRSVQDAARAS